MCTGQCNATAAIPRKFEEEVQYLVKWGNREQPGQRPKEKSLKCPLFEVDSPRQYLKIKRDEPESLISVS